MSSQVVALFGLVCFLMVAVAFDAYCLRDLREAPFVFVFSPETWERTKSASRSLTRVRRSVLRKSG